MKPPRIVKGGLDIHKIIGKIPFKPKKGFVLPYHKYTGPWNPLEKQLDSNDNPLPGQEPFNGVDDIARKHDICYRDHDNKDGKKNCDKEMLIELKMLKPKNKREMLDRAVVRGVIGTKHKLGFGIRWSNELADELHKMVRKKFQKRKVVANSIDEIWAADLVEMQTFAKTNRGYKYLLMVIDIFSKYGWIVPLKSKTAAAVTDAFQDIFKEGRIPAKMWTDKGKEFYNKLLTNLLQKNNVHLYSTENEEKSTVVERWNRTIKRIMWKFFTANNTNKYINVLPSLVEKYNHTYHRSIKCTPTEASKPENSASVFEALYGDTPLLKKIPKYKVGDEVRIAKKKKTFEKGYTPNWTEEVFTISEVKSTKPPTYKIKDSKGEEIQGTFYEPELQKTTQTIFRIERVLKRRTKNGRKEIYVKWKGYNKDFNSWISIDNLHNDHASK
jgi:hypothetical protein